MSTCTQRLRPRLACVLLLCTSPAALANGYEVPLETVHFEIDFATTFGDSVFVLGDIPELGDGDVTRAVKLVPGVYDPGPPPSLDWSIDVAIPQGRTFEYSYVLRSDAIGDLSDPTNGSVISGPFPAATAPPAPLTRRLRFYRPNTPAITEITFNTPTGPVLRAFIPAPGAPDWIVATLDDQPKGFGIDAEINAVPVRTPLHTAVRRAGQIYAYVPDLTSTTTGARQVFAVPTTHVAATRTVNGVTGRGIEVWTPRGYPEHTDRSYPVLYMHDGQNVFIPGGPFGTWAAEVVTEDLIKKGRIRELIIVAIDNSGDRLAEYNPDWSGSINDQYNAFIVEDLMPFVDANFRTLTGPVHTGVMGSSFGGIASLSLALEHPDRFGLIGAMSTSFGLTAIDDRLAAGELPPASRLYLDAGDINDGAGNTIAVRDALLSIGRVLDGNLFFQIGYGHQHNEVAWNDRLDEALLALLPIAENGSTIDLPVPGPGDIDGSGCVDLDDLTRLLRGFGSCVGDAGHDPAADVDASGCVDLDDLTIVLMNFHAGC